MTSPNNNEGSGSKRIKLAGRTSYGSRPRGCLDEIQMMEFRILDFANLTEKINERIVTDTIKAHGHLWKLYIYPRGDNISKNIDAEYVSIFLYYDGENETEFAARFSIETTTDYEHVERHDFSRKRENKSRKWGFSNFAKRREVIENDCDEEGTLTIAVDLENLAGNSVWFPKSTNHDAILSSIFRSTKTSDVSFTVGNTQKEFKVHKNVLAVRARDLYELVLVEESSSSNNANGLDDCANVVISDVDEDVFEALLEYIYMGKEPKLMDEDTAKLIFLAADRFCCIGLKLYTESVLTSKFLVPSKAVALLLFADSHSCALLKEYSMNMYATNPSAVMESKSDWMKLKESNDLLEELLVHTNASRKQYASVANSNPDEEGIDNLDVTSLRERLQAADLDIDGSYLTLVERWKEHLRVE
jgi:hypothetical protein